MAIPPKPGVVSSCKDSAYLYYPRKFAKRGRARVQTSEAATEMIQLRKAMFAAACAVGLSLTATPSFSQTTLKAVMHSDLKILDPIWTTAYIVRDHGYMIYDTLFATDEKGDESKLALASLRPVVELI